MDAADDTCTAELHLGNDTLRCMLRAGHSEGHVAPKPPSLDETHLRYGVAIDIGTVAGEADS